MDYGLDNASTETTTNAATLHSESRKTIVMRSNGALGTSTHTTTEVRDAVSVEILYHSDTNGQRRPDKDRGKSVIKKSCRGYN